MLARLRARKAPSGLPALLIGTGADTRTLARTPYPGVLPVGFLDDEHTGTVEGLPVLGRISQLREAATTAAAQAVLVSHPGRSAMELASLSEAAAGAGLAFGHADQAVAPTRLLGREPADFDHGRIRRAVQGRRVLVTGADDPVGAQLITCLHAAGAGAVEVADRHAVEGACERIRPELVFHADLMHDLKLAEREPCAAVARNVGGTHRALSAAMRHGAERFVLVSGVEAADPASVLGASYRVAELTVQAKAGMGLRLAAARVATLVATPASLLSELARQAGAGEAMTVAHPNATRYFMTLSEAVHLTLEAVALAEQGEAFALDVGEPTPVVSLVHTFAEQLRLPQVRIRFKGLESGERLDDKLFSGGELRTRTANPQVWAARPGPAPTGQAVLLERLHAAADRGSEQDVRMLLRRLLPEYRTAPVRAPNHLIQEVL
ncbi:polysaccharide biosynthesis protein [Nonomuraea sediminis]|uniref:polysaccharide biosynthesis protein n=1 Tax=Nonomuraea sediminis TaxID=2835864 RepID=UPI001BDD5BF4|nr:polysaccharide biosynthesis protein [Nonomuraea sediminis]